MRFRITILSIGDPLFRQPFARWTVITAAAVLALAWIAMLAVPRLPGDDAVVLHYTTTFGVDALGRWAEILRLPLVGSAVLMGNVLVARWMASEGARGDRTGDAHGAATDDTQPPPAAHARTAEVRLLLIATLLVEFAVLLGAALLWRVNSGSLSGSNGF